MFQLILLICSTLFLILLMGMLDYVIGLMVWLGVFDGLEWALETHFMQDKALWKA